MKKSNKILLSGFLVVILLITGIHITLYAKYKSGYYTIYRPENRSQQESIQSFPKVSHVVIRDCKASAEFGNVLSIDKDIKGGVQYVQQQDTLFVTTIGKGAGLVTRGYVQLILPADATIFAFNTDISFENVNDSSSIHPTFVLDHSEISVRSSVRSSVLGHVKLNASNGSAAYFHGNTIVDYLEVELKKSSLDYNQGEIGQLSIATDSTSQVILQSRHLLKAKITSIPDNQ
jgi:hypothetical protein